MREIFYILFVVIVTHLIYLSKLIKLYALRSVPFAVRKLYHKGKETNHTCCISQPNAHHGSKVETAARRRGSRHRGGCRRGSGTLRARSFLSRPHTWGRQLSPRRVAARGRGQGAAAGTIMWVGDSSHSGVVMRVEWIEVGNTQFLARYTDHYKWIRIFLKNPRWENVLELEGGDDCLTVWIHENSLNCVLWKGEFYGMRIISQ